MALLDFRAIYLPYCLQKQKDGTWVVLNREYKPVGFNTYDWIDYKDFPVSVHLSGLDESLLSRIAYNGEVENDSIFLYNDGCNPINSDEHMKAYLDRLALLGKLPAGQPCDKIFE